MTAPEFTLAPCEAAQRTDQSIVMWVRRDGHADLVVHLDRAEARRVRDWLSHRIDDGPRPDTYQPVPGGHVFTTCPACAGAGFNRQTTGVDCGTCDGFGRVPK